MPATNPPPSANTTRTSAPMICAATEALVDVTKEAK